MLIIIIFQTNIKHTFIGSMFYHKNNDITSTFLLFYIVKTPKDKWKHYVIEVFDGCSIPSHSSTTARTAPSPLIEAINPQFLAFAHYILRLSCSIDAAPEMSGMFGNV